MPLKQVAMNLGIASTLLCGVAVRAAETIKPSFVQTGMLRSCLDPGFAPMEFYANPGDAQPSGVDVDITKALAELWGVKMQLMPVEFTGMLSALQAKRCDAVISAVLLKPERVAVLSAIPYLASHIVVVGLADSDIKATSELDLAGLTIATQSGTAYAGMLEGFNKKIVAAGRKPILIQTYPKDSDAIQQLLVGRAAGVATQDVGLAHYNTKGVGEFRILLQLPDPDVFAIYLRQGAEDQAAMAAGIAQLRSNGTMKQIIEHWNLPSTALDIPGN